MGSDQHYSLRWNDYTVKIVTAFQSLRDEEDFVDVTVACDGHSYSAHKMVLSACSPYFRVLLRANPCQHPIVILKDVGHTEMERLLEFMYNGEVSIAQDQLAAFLKTAENLKIRGLAGNSDDMEQFQRADISYNYNSRCSMGGGGTSGRSSPSVSYAPSQASKDDELTTDVPSGYLSRNPDSPPSKRRKRSSAPAASHSDANAASHSKECVVSESGVEVSGSSASDGCGIVGAQGSGPNDSDDPRQECRELKTEPQDPILDVYAEGPDLGSDPQGQQHQTGDPLDTRSSVMYPLAMPGPSGTLGGQDTSQEPGGPEEEAIKTEEFLECSTTPPLSVTAAQHQAFHPTGIGAFGGLSWASTHQSQAAPGSSGTTDNQCMFCFKSFSNRGSMTRHLRDQHLQPGATVTCDICGKICKNRNCLITHRSVAHSSRRRTRPPYNLPLNQQQQGIKDKEDLQMQQSMETESPENVLLSVLQQPSNGQQHQVDQSLQEKELWPDESSIDKNVKTPLTVVTQQVVQMDHV